MLCPSLTIEDGLKEKFKNLSGNARIKKSIPESAKYKNPSIVDANVTVKNGDICVENIHAVYEKTGSSISDSFKNQGNRVLVLNDESHHIFNTISGNTTEKKGIKRGKNFYSILILISDIFWVLQELLTTIMNIFTSSLFF